MKKAFALIMSILMILTLFTACGGGEDTDTTKENKAESSEETDSNKENDSEAATKAPEEADKEEEEELVTAWVVTEWKNSDGTTSEFIYDDNWCRISERVLDAEGNVIDEYFNMDSDSYDANGNPTLPIAGGGVEFLYEYNEYSDCTKYGIRDDFGLYEWDFTNYEYIYDDEGRMLSMIEWSCEDYDDYQYNYSVTQYEYNENGELTAEMFMSNWTRTRTEYTYTDSLLTKETQYREVTDSDIYEFYCESIYTYDSKNRIDSVTTEYADGNTYNTEYTYSDHEDGTYDISDEWQTYTYDEHGNLIAMKYNNDESVFAEITYTPVQVTPIRAKAIERDYHDISFYRLQK